MLKKLFNKIKGILNNNYKFIIVLIFMIFISTFKLPFYIEKTGGVIDLKDRVDNNINYSGSLNMSYVSSLNATIPTYIISLFNSNWDAVTIKEENGTGTSKDTIFRNNIALEESIDSAVINAYKYSNKKLKVLNEDIYVTYIYEDAKTNLKVGDIIKQIDDVDILTKEDILNYLNTTMANQKIKIKVINNDKEYERYAKIIEHENKKIIGIITYSDYKIKNNNLKISFEPNESGPSGGLMLSLAIYSQINHIDLTNGYNIAGTGTIDINGNVGSISGVKYKLAGAVKNNMDIFLVPNGENYKEAIKEKNKNNYNIDIYGIDTFEDAIKALKKLGKKS